MKRKAIAIDIDDVMVAHVDAFLEFSNKNYGTNYTIEDYCDRWGILWKIEDDAEIKRRAREFHTPESAMSYRFLDGAKDAIEQLGKSYDLYIVTARPEYLVEITQEWVNMHLNGVFKGVHFVPIWIPENKVTKADICRQIGASYLIDDVVKHCNLAAEGGITAVLFGDYAWNRNDEIKKGVVRCKDWQEVVNFLQGDTLQKG